MWISYNHHIIIIQHVYILNLLSSKAPLGRFKGNSTPFKLFTRLKLNTHSDWTQRLHWQFYHAQQACPLPQRLVDGSQFTSPLTMRHVCLTHKLHVARPCSLCSVS